MAKTKEELNQLKIEYESLAIKLKELDEEELLLVTGGSGFSYVIPESDEIHNYHIYSDEIINFDPDF